jgi:hypothetical protein
MSQSEVTALSTRTRTGDRPVDLWAELDRLTRADAARLASRREDVRRSRIARRNAIPLAS